MDFKPTSCARHRFQAFTLVEFLVAMSIGLLIIGGGLALWAYGTKTCASILAYVELSTASKNAMDRMSQQIRNAKSVASCSSDKLVLFVPGRTAGYAHTMTYTYDPTNKWLRQTLAKNPGNEESLTLLTGCTNLSFS